MEKKVYVIFVEKCSTGAMGYDFYVFSTLKNAKEGMKKLAHDFETVQEYFGNMSFQDEEYTYTEGVNDDDLPSIIIRDNCKAMTYVYLDIYERTLDTID